MEHWMVAQSTMMCVLCFLMALLSCVKTSHHARRLPLCFPTPCIAQLGFGLVFLADACLLSNVLALAFSGGQCNRVLHCLVSTIAVASHYQGHWHCDGITSTIFACCS
jgi:glucan phosphoethanolaminetransferase (alkaline phosphatase superfamily)